MEDDLGVGGRLHQRAVTHQLPAQRQSVGEIAVVADGEAAAVELGEQRLHVAQDGLAGGRIAHMPDGDRAGQAVDHLAAGEALTHEAHAALGVETLAVVGDDAGRFLAAMLEGVQSESCDRRGIRVAEHAEHAALLTQPVVVEAICVRSFDHFAHRVSKPSITTPSITKPSLTMPSPTAPSNTMPFLTTSSLSRAQRTAIVPSISFCIPERSDCP